MLGAYARSFGRLHAALVQIQTQPEASAELRLWVQDELLRRLTYLERRKVRVRARLRETQQRLTRTDSPRLTKVEATATKHLCARLREQVERYQYLAFLFRTIGDGLAYSYIDSWDIKPLAFKEPAGDVSRNPGSRAERRMLRRLSGAGFPVLLNDLTNCLRYGDLTLAGPERPVIFEVKRARQLSEKDLRQIAEMRKIRSYLHNDLTTSFRRKNWTAFRSAVPSPPRYYHREFAGLLRTALRQGTAWCTPEPGLLYYATAVGDLVKLHELAHRYIRDPYLLVVSRHGRSPAYFPYPLILKETDTLVAFLQERVHALVLMDLAVLKFLLAARGCGMEVLDKAAYAFVLRPHDPASPLHGVHIGHHMVGRIGMEFLSLKWMVEASTRDLVPLDDPIEAPLAEMHDLGGVVVQVGQTRAFAPFIEREAGWPNR